MGKREEIKRLNEALERMAMRAFEFWFTSLDKSPDNAVLRMLDETMRASFLAGYGAATRDLAELNALAADIESHGL